MGRSAAMEGLLEESWKCSVAICDDFIQSIHSH